MCHPGLRDFMGVSQQSFARTAVGMQSFKSSHDMSDCTAVSLSKWANIAE